MASKSSFPGHKHRGGKSSNRYSSFKSGSSSSSSSRGQLINISEYIRTGVLNIPKEVWAKIPRERYYEIEEQLASLIMADKMEFPLKVFYMSHPSNLIGNKTNCKIEEMDYNSKGMIPSYMGGKVEVPYVNKRGNTVAFFFDEGDYDRLDIITEWFTQHVRITGCVRGKTVPSMAWKILAKRVVKEAISISTKTSKLGVYELGEAIYASGIKECNNFKVSVAMAVYNAFQPKIVYDMSAGWGDRVIAAALSDTVRTYVGTDPNHDLMTPYSQIKEFFESRNPRKRLDIYNYGAEALPLEGIFGLPGDKRNPDLIFSSPPFFDYEEYSKADTQSISKHDTYQDWMDNWLVPTTIQNLRILKKGGHLIYHLGFIGKETPIGDNLITALAGLEDVNFKGIIPLFSRQNQNKRPIYFYVWHKKV